MSAITVTQFRKAVWDLISALSAPLVPAARVVWLEQGSPRPKNPYIGLNVVSGPRSYGDDDMRQNSPGVYSFEGQRAFTVSVNAYGKDADEIAALITNGLSKVSAMELLAARSVALLSNTSPKNVSVPLETNFENRTQFDMDFGCVMAITENVGFIEQTGILNNASGDQTDIG